MSNYYELLGIQKGASDEEIAKGYKKMAAKWHPDKHLTNKEYAEEMFKKVGRANEVLKNPQTREIYECFGEEGLKNGPPSMGGSGGMPFNPFEMFGGGMFPGGMFPGGRGPTGPSDENRPIIHRVNCTLKDTYTGSKHNEHIERDILCNHCEGTGFKDKISHCCTTCNGKGIQVIVHQIAPGMVQQATRSCSICKGTGNDQTHVQCEKCNGSKKSKETITINVEIKKGTKPNGQPFIIKGKGNQIGKNAYGDIAIVYNISDDPIYSRKENDLYRKLDISLRKALLGFKIKLEHLDGKQIQVESSNVIQPFSIKKIPKLGFVDPQTGIIGDYYIEFNVIFPERYNSKQLKALDLVLHKEPEDTTDDLGPNHQYKLEDTIHIPKGSTRYYKDLDDQMNEDDIPDGPQNVKCAQQ
jgi:DnaJ family protein A protein 2